MVKNRGRKRRGLDGGPRKNRRRRGRKPTNADGSYRPAGPGERNSFGESNRKLARKQGYEGPWPPGGPLWEWLISWGEYGKDGWQGADCWDEDAHPELKDWRDKQKAWDREGKRYRNRGPEYLGWREKEEGGHSPDEDGGDGGDGEEDDDEWGDDEEDEEEEEEEEEEEVQRETGKAG